MRQYPYYGINNYGHIVLFVYEKSGFFVKSGSEKKLLNTWHTNFNEDDFKETVFPVWKNNPNSWSELGVVSGVVIGPDSVIARCTRLQTSDKTRNVFPKAKYAEAVIVLAQLLQLRDAWGGCELFPYKVNHGPVYIPILSFETEEIKDAFQKKFTDLIQKIVCLYH